MPHGLKSYDWCKSEISLGHPKHDLVGNSRTFGNSKKALKKYVGKKACGPKKSFWPLRLKKM